jgi:hypothetical protein
VGSLQDQVVGRATEQEVRQKLERFKLKGDNQITAAIKAET